MVLGKTHYTVKIKIEGNIEHLEDRSIVDNAAELASDVFMDNVPGFKWEKHTVTFEGERAKDKRAVS